MDETTFERERLALFADHGFDGESRRITDAAGRTTYMIERGDGARRTVLVHGGLSEASEWSLMAGMVPGPVVIPDRPGFGLSYKPDYADVDVRASAVAWMDHVIDHLDADQIDLVANSLGGFFSIAFALAHPERVRRLVLVGAAAGLHREVPLILRLWGNPITGPIIANMETTTAEEYRDGILGSIAVEHPEDVPVDLLEIMLAAAHLPGVNHSATTLLRNLLTLRGWRRDLLLRDEMADLRIPTLFLWGELDKFAPPERGETVATRMPHAAFERVADAGHMTHLDAPDTIATRVTEFLGLTAG